MSERRYSVLIAPLRALGHGLMRLYVLLRLIVTLGGALKPQDRMRKEDSDG